MDLRKGEVLSQILIDPASVMSNCQKAIKDIGIGAIAADQY